MTEFNEDTLLNHLDLYYKKLFPIEPYYKWLCYGEKRDFDHREISFTLAGNIYIRYQSFSDKNELMEALQKQNPTRINIGAIYNVKPCERDIVDTCFWPVAKEIFFDIDMTDYDEVRICCNGDDICTKCWKFMIIACKILDAALREDFGYEHLLRVFSGRRGIHCWVCDESARKLNSNERGAVEDYLNLIKGGADRAKKVTLHREQIHTSIERALSIIETYFEDVCLIDQDILGTDKRVNNFIKLISIDKDEMEQFREAIMTETTSKERWNAFVAHWESLKAAGTLNKSMRNLVKEIMLHFTYPRLDINVSKGMNHLLKSPFCVHPKTGKVCLPFNPGAVEKFNPCTVPNVTSLEDEINAYDAKTQEQEKDDFQSCKTTSIRDYKKTSMLKAVIVFEEFVRKLETDWRGKNIETSDTVK